MMSFSPHKFIVKNHGEDIKKIKLFLESAGLYRSEHVAFTGREPSLHCAAWKLEPMEEKYWLEFVRPGLCKVARRMDARVRVHSIAHYGPTEGVIFAIDWDEPYELLNYDLTEVQDGSV